MASFTNPEREGRSGWGTWQESAIKEGKKTETKKQRTTRLLAEVMTEPTGFGAPRAPPVSAHGPLFSGWVPNPERVVTSPPWLQVDCCTRWPAHNESFINALCGHRIHEGCIATLHRPYGLDACPICTSRATHYEREGLSTPIHISSLITRFVLHILPFMDVYLSSFCSIMLYTITYTYRSHSLLYF